VDLTIDMGAISETDMVSGVCTVTGTVSDPAYAVWVNGIPATVYSNGSWMAEGVPAGEGGTAVFLARERVVKVKVKGSGRELWKGEA
jgi:hypothetical protein